MSIDRICIEDAMQLAGFDVDCPWRNGDELARLQRQHALDQVSSTLK